MANKTTIDIDILYLREMQSHCDDEDSNVFEENNMDLMQIIQKRVNTIENNLT